MATVLIYNLSHPTCIPKGTQWTKILTNLGISNRMITNNDVPVLSYKFDTSVKKLSKIVENENTKYIIGLFEPTLPIIAEVNKQFGLPGHITESAKVSCNKNNWYDFCIDNNINIPEQFTLTSLEQLRGLDYKHIVKTNLGAGGSDHIRKSTDGIDENIFEYDKDFLGELICQRLLDIEDHFFINFFCCNQGIYYPQICKVDTYANGEPYRYTSEYDNKYVTVGKELIVRAMKSLNVSNIHGSAEMIVEDGKVYWHDANFRQGGYKEMICASLEGIEYQKESIKAFLNPQYVPTIKWNGINTCLRSIDSLPLGKHNIQSNDMIYADGNIITMEVNNTFNYIITQSTDFNESIYLADECNDNIGKYNETIS